MNDEENHDQTSLIHLSNQSLSTQPRNLVRRGLNSLKSKEGLIVHFPVESSLGRYVIKKEGEHLYPFAVTKEAIGDVFVPAGMRLALEIKTDTNVFALVNLVPDVPLYLRCVKVTDQGLAHIKRLTSLKELYLWELNNISDEGLVHLQELTSLEILDLRHNNISDGGLVHLQKLTSLKKLNLGDNKIGDQGLIHLQELTSLKKLNIGRNNITDAGLRHLSKMKSLEELDLGDNKIGGQGLVYLQNLNYLKTLNLSRNNISDEGVVHLQELASLKILHICFYVWGKHKGLLRLKERLPECKIEITHLPY